MKTITLGDHKLVVVPQRHARLRHYLGGADFSKVLSMDYAHEAYRLLAILIPTLPAAIPEWEWEGYATQEDWENQRYSEAADRSPTTEEIALAFETCLTVNGAGRLGKVLDIVKLGMTAAESDNRISPTPGSPVSLGASGE